MLLQVQVLAVDRPGAAAVLMQVQVLALDRCFGPDSFCKPRGSHFSMVWLWIGVSFVLVQG